MDRRVSGGLLLVCALLSILVVPRLLNPTVVDGTARVVPPPPPPVVGECLRDAQNSTSFNEWGFLVQPSSVVVVACTEPHRSEVINVDLDFDPVPLDQNEPFTTLDDPCSSPSNIDLAYLGLDTGETDWRPVLAMSTGVLGPDQRQFRDGQRWAACTIITSLADVTEPMQGMFDRDGAPPSLAVCYTGDDADRLRVHAMCTGPHTAELLAGRYLEPGGTTPQRELAAECGELATAAMRRSPADTPGLSVLAQTEAYYQDGEPVVVDAPLPIDAIGGWSGCIVVAADGRRLNASLRQIGNAALPWAP